MYYWNPNILLTWILILYFSRKRFEIFKDQHYSCSISHIIKQNILECSYLFYLFRSCTVQSMYVCLCSCLLNAHKPNTYLFPELIKAYLLSNIVALGFPHEISHDLLLGGGLPLSLPIPMSNIWVTSNLSYIYMLLSVDVTGFSHCLAFFIFY